MSQVLLQLVVPSLKQTTVDVDTVTNKKEFGNVQYVTAEGSQYKRDELSTFFTYLKVMSHSL